MVVLIPIFTSQLEKAREATDAANLRAAYAEVVSDQLTNGGTTETKEVVLTQQKKGWQDTSITKIGDTTIDSNDVLSNADKGQTIVVGYDSTNNKATYSVKQ